MHTPLPRSEATRGHQTPGAEITGCDLDSRAWRQIQVLRGEASTLNCWATSPSYLLFFYNHNPAIINLFDFTLGIVVPISNPSTLAAEAGQSER